MNVKYITKENFDFKMKLYNAVEVSFKPINNVFPGSGFKYRFIELIQNSFTTYLYEYYMKPPIYTKTLYGHLKNWIMSCMNYTASIVMWIMYICFLELTPILIVNSVYLLTYK